MHRFTYHEPSSSMQAVKMLSEFEDAKVLAGGTDLLVGMRKGALLPKHIINIKTALELSGINAGPDGIAIGAATTMYETEKYLHHLPEYHVLCQAIHHVASCQIRNRATVAGNLCNASPAADTASALLAMGASVKVLGVNGERIIPIDKLFVRPRQTTLAQDELITAVLLPIMKGMNGIFLRKSRRPSVDLATVNVAVVTDNKTVRIALGAVAPTVVRAIEAEELLNREGLNQTTAVAAAKLAQRSASPISDLRGTKEYRLELVQVLTERALLALAGGEA
ncbi:MAG: CoxM [Anaerosporomusa subterranea]|nr:CoxM [Anaerosporomusa subterranea]